MMIAGACSKGALLGLKHSGTWKPFKSNKKCFLFRLKSSFRSQDTYVFVLIFMVI